MRRYLLLAAILCLGFFVRAYHLSGNPQGFFCDEAAVGYNAYAILHTGKDEYGVPFPIFFRSFGDYKTPILIYANIPAVALLGLTEFAVRITSVLFGMAAIVVMYFFGKELSEKRREETGLLAALITASMPWFIHYNRTGFDINAYCTFFALTAYLFIRAAHDKRMIIPAFISAGFTLYTYNPERLLLPLLLAGAAVIYGAYYRAHRKEMVIGFLLFCALSIPLVVSFFTGSAFALFTTVVMPQANAWNMLKNYVLQLTPGYFVYGEPTVLVRHFVGGLRPLLLVTVPFAYVGIACVLLRWRKNNTYRFLLYWLLIYPVAGAITTDGGPFTSRSVIGAPLFALLISLGIVRTVAFLKCRVRPVVSATVILLAVILNLVLFARFYFYQYPFYSMGFTGWQYGARDIVRYFAAHETEYNGLFIGADPEFSHPEIFFKFYAPGDCQHCMVGYPDTNYIPGRRQLFAVSPGYITSHPQYTYTIVRTVYYPNGDPAFYLVRVREAPH